MLRGKFLAIICGFMAMAPVPAWAADTVDGVMDDVITRFYANMPEEKLYALDNDKVMELLTDDELAVLATKHLYFDVDVPVVVSILRSVEQSTIPYWLEPAGFEKTGMTMTNMEGWEYEVWQKEYPAGRVELGVNGFEYHRPHYLVCVGPQNDGDTVTISNLHPGRFPVVEMKEGAMTYNDWTELVVTELPDALKGQHLLTTIRGRGRESSIVNSFRKTDFPSSEKPSPVFVTWAGDTATTQSIQWRTNTEVDEGMVRYWKGEADGEPMLAMAEVKTIQDRMLANDRYCNWFTARLDGLEPDTTYAYQAGSAAHDTWSEIASFTTAPEGPKKFSFFHCSDTHSSNLWGSLVWRTFEDYPDTDFMVISGDLVGTGMEREDYDAFLAYGNPMFKTRPIMPSIGNHDAQLGFPPDIYMDVFDLPRNGPDELTPERTYSFKYGNAEFFSLDVMSPTDPTAEWLEKKLAASDATWKIAYFHFPFYASEKRYPHLHEKWGTLFDKYHVDVALAGHVHYYIRTHPMKGGEIMESPADGTVYVTSVSIPSRPYDGEMPEYGVQQAGGGRICNRIEIEGNRLSFQALDIEGAVRDEFVIEK